MVHPLFYVKVKRDCHHKNGQLNYQGIAINNLTEEKIMVKVKNINGSGFYNGAPAGYSSWLAYWEDKAQRKAYRCSATDCREWTSDLVGAHVKKVGSYDQKYYIVPLCRGCNKRTDEFYVDAELIPCPSNI